MSVVAPTGRQALDAALAAHRAAGGLVLGERPGATLLTPLSESATLGLAGGLALAGKKVVVELVEAAGLVRAADVAGDLGEIAARSRGAWSAPVLVLAPLGEGEALPALPAGWRSFVVGRAGDVGALYAAAAAAAPAVLFLTEAALDGREAAQAAGPGAALLRAGARVTLAALGAGVPVALAAAELLAAAGVEAEVLDLRGPAGADAALVASVKKTGRVVLVGHGPADAALYAAAFWNLESEPRAVAATAGVEALVGIVHETLEA